MKKSETTQKPFFDLKEFMHNGQFNYTLLKGFYINTLYKNNIGPTASYILILLVQSYFNAPAHIQNGDFMSYIKSIRTIEDLMKYIDNTEAREYLLTARTADYEFKEFITFRNLFR